MLLKTKLGAPDAGMPDSDVDGSSLARAAPAVAGIAKKSETSAAHPAGAIKFLRQVVRMFSLVKIGAGLNIRQELNPRYGGASVP